MSDETKAAEEPILLEIEQAAIAFDETYLKSSDSEKVREARRFGFSIGASWQKSKERERMIHLLCWHEDSYSDERGLASKVDEFLQGGK
jgi:hypothetical protein